jgi:uncharacterized protein (TIGR02145 family)
MQAAGTYSTTVTYTAVGEPVPEVQILFTSTVIQDLTAAECSSVTTGQIGEMTDIRNSQKYRVRKMEDGKCWMIDNLKLESGSYNGTTTDLVNSTDSVYINLGYYDGTDYWTSSTTPFIYDPEGLNFSSSCNYNSPYTYNVNSLTGCGYLYNWSAATAATGNSLIGGQEAPGSICPINWHLPSVTNFSDLIVAMANSNSLGDSENLGPDGLWQGTFAHSWYYQEAPYNPGYDARYWSSTSDGSDLAYRLDFDSYSSDNAYTIPMDNKRGQSVRCVVSP